VTSKSFCFLHHIILLYLFFTVLENEKKVDKSGIDSDKITQESVLKYAALVRVIRNKSATS
jgi:hypothetical protein